MLKQQILNKALNLTKKFNFTLNLNSSLFNFFFVANAIDNYPWASFSEKNFLLNLIFPVPTVWSKASGEVLHINIRLCF
jgi:hypothetical protein